MGLILRLERHRRLNPNPQPPTNRALTSLDGTMWNHTGERFKIYNAVPHGICKYPAVILDIDGHDRDENATARYYSIGIGFLKSRSISFFTWGGSIKVSNAVAPIEGAGGGGRCPSPQDSQKCFFIGFIDSMFNIYIHAYQALVHFSTRIDFYKGC